MSVVASKKYIRITPRKMMVVANQIRGKKLQAAIDYLTFCKRQAARPMLKLIKSAMSNAKVAGGVDIDNLCISKLLVDKGPTMKRWMPRAKGMATQILKRSSHLFVELEEK